MRIGAGAYIEADTASATTCDIGTPTAIKQRITGTATITSLGTGANKLRFVKFAGILTLTHNGTSLILPGAANITTAAGDTAVLMSDGSGNWTCHRYTRASGKALVGPAAADITDATSDGRALLTAANVAAQRTALALGTMATQAASAVTISGGTIAGITDLAVADGGTGASTDSGARTNLGLAIGTDVQAHDAELDALAGLTSAADKVPYFTGSGTAAVTTYTAAARTFDAAVDAAAERVVLGLVIGTNVQAWDADLDALAGLAIASDTLPYGNGSHTMALATFTAAGRALVDDADATAQRTTLGLGSIATYAEASAAEYRAATASRALSAANVWSAADWVALTDAATVAVDLSTGINFTVTLGGNRTLGNPSSTKNGQSGVIEITQDGTGSRTLAYASNWKFVGGIAPVLTTTVGAIDCLYYTVKSSSRIIASLSPDVK